MLIRTYFWVMLFSIGVTLGQTSVDDFKLTDAITGKEVSLNTFNDKKAVVLIFMSVDCPYGQFYAKRITKLINKFPEMAFVLINPNNSINNNNAAMSSFVQKNGLKCTFLKDEALKVANSLGISKIPECFLIDVKNGNKLIYQGAIDDSPQLEEDVSKNYLETVLSNFGNNKPATYSKTQAVGCPAKF